VSKWEIDLLVTLGLRGPVEADETWRPFEYLVNRMRPGIEQETATKLGAMLWQANADVALDPDDEPQPEYGFEPMPVEVTAVEGLKALSHYRYQSDGDAWPGSAADGYCTWLEHALIGVLPGWDEAPWGWGAPEVDMRREQGRAAAAATAPDRLPPTAQDAAEALAILDAGGVRLAPSGEIDPDTPGPFAEDAPRRKLGYWTPVDHSRSGRVQLRLYADADAAHAAYLRRRTEAEEQIVWPPVWPVLVARYGRLLLEARASRDDAGGAVWAAIDALGDPDEHWLSDRLPVPAAGLRGTVLATRIPVSRPLSGGRTAAFIGDSPATVERIAGYLDNEQDRARVLATDLDRQSVVMLYGMADLAGVHEARVRELADSPEHEPRHALELHLDGLCPSAAVVLALDAMPVRPTEVILTGPGFTNKGRSIPAFPA
jgi:hypothetical protein